MGEAMLFVHYDQVYDGSALGRLSEALDVELDQSFVDRALKRTRATGEMPPRARAIYETLCQAAGCASGVTA